MEELKAIWEDISKPFKELNANQKKYFAGFWKSFVQEGWYFMLGIALEGGKNLGWRGYLFVWPFLLAFGIAGLLLVWTVVKPFIS